MTQSLILLTTLAVMLGLGVGYWFGYMLDVITEAVAEIFGMTVIVGVMDKELRDLGMMIKDGRAYE